MYLEVFVEDASHGGERAVVSLVLDEPRLGNTKLLWVNEDEATRLSEGLKDKRCQPRRCTENPRRVKILKCSLAKEPLHPGFEKDTGSSFCSFCFLHFLETVCCNMLENGPLWCHKGHQHLPQVPDRFVSVLSQTCGSYNKQQKLLQAAVHRFFGG